MPFEPQDPAALVADDHDVLRELTGGEGAEHSFDAAGIQQTLQTALLATRKSGTVTIISIWEGPVQINPNDIVVSELNVLGTICYTPEDFADTIAMIQDGRIKTEGMVTERIALTDVVAASTRWSSTRTAT